MGNSQTIDIGGKQLRIKKQVGEGAYSFIFLAEDDRGNRYALKQVIMPSGDVERNQMAQKEQLIMKTLPLHPNIVPVYGATVIEEPGKINYFTLLHFCPSSVLSIMNDIYSKGSLLSERLALKIFQSAALAVLHMHTQIPPLAHRDIKVENMLLSDDGNYKLCDFGSCIKCPLPPQPQAPLNGFSAREVMSADDEMKRNTTPAYRAPEQVDMYTRKVVCELVDVWAVGIMLYKLTVGRTPFEDSYGSGTVNNMGILNAQVKFPTGYTYSNCLQEYIKYILVPDVELRPNIFSLLLWGEVSYARGELNDWSSLLNDDASGSVEDAMSRVYNQPLRCFSSSSSSSLSNSNTPIRRKSPLATVNNTQTSQFTPLPNPTSTSSSFSSLISRRVFNFSKSVGNMLANLAGADMEFYHWICKCSTVPPSSSSSSYQLQIKPKFVRRISDVIELKQDKFNDFMYFVSLRIANLDKIDGDDDYYISLIRLFCLVLLVLDELGTRRGIDCNQFSDYSQFIESLARHISLNKSDGDNYLLIDLCINFLNLLSLILTTKSSNITASEIPNCLDSMLSKIAIISKSRPEFVAKVQVVVYSPILIYAKRVLVGHSNNSNNDVILKFQNASVDVTNEEEEEEDEEVVHVAPITSAASIKSNPPTPPLVTLDDFTHLSSFDVFQTNDPRAHEFDVAFNKKKLKKELDKLPSDDNWSGWVANPPAIVESNMATNRAVASSSHASIDLLGLNDDDNDHDAVEKLVNAPSFSGNISTASIANIKPIAKPEPSSRSSSKSLSLLDGYEGEAENTAPKPTVTAQLPMNDMMQVMTQPALQPWRQANLISDSALAHCLDSVLMEFMSWDIEIPFSSLSVVEVIGTGGFAIVYKAILSDNGQTVAIKKLQSPMGTSVEPKTLLDFKSEADFMRKLSHENIIGLIGLAYDPLCMILEYCSNGSLFSMIHDKTSNNLTWSVRYRLLIGIACGMQYLHSFRPPIIHRDLKSLNILLSDDFSPKITDFGLSRLSSSSGDEDQFMTSQAGTYQWMAIEIITGQKKYNEKVDVYSFAVIMWEVLTMLIPFDGMQPIQIVAHLVARNERLKFPPAMLEAASGNEGLRQIIRLIQECWQTNPTSRPSFLDIVSRLRNLPENII